MLNKAFEIIEARWLFGIEASRIEALVHPQSVIHSMVETCDGAMLAQLGVPDMHLPIRYALADGRRLPAPERRLTVADLATLTFEAPDPARFPCLGLAPLCLERGGNTACIVNAAAEVADAAFLERRLRFTDIYSVITGTLERVAHIASPAYDDYVATNAEARRVAADIAARLAGTQ